MNKIYYKFKRYDNTWSCIFLKESNEEGIESEIDIINNISDLKNYLESNKDYLFIGANNYIYDNILIASLLKNNNLEDVVTEEDIIKYLPRNIDITQGIVRNELKNFDSIKYTLWQDNNPIYQSQFNSKKDLVKELYYDIFLIKYISNLPERKSFIDWKCEVVNRYNLSDEAYQLSFSKLMQAITGIEVSNDKYGLGTKFKIDDKLEYILTNLNDPFLNNIYNMIKEYYKNPTDTKPSLKIDNCNIKFNEQGILGTNESYIYDISKDNTYLYIDFNSFGPSILINNEYLKDIATNYKNYEDVKNERIRLKSINDSKQLYYKDILNSGLDILSNLYDKDLNNIGISLSVTGIMTMMLLYSYISKYNINLIECNTDGLIIKCPKDKIKDIRREVKRIENQLNLSCDVDEVNKIIHFNEKNYIMQFTNGKIKHIGIFGAFQENILNYTGIKAIDTSIRNYYLYNIPIIETLSTYLKNNDLEAFQIIKKEKSNEKTKYIKVNNTYIELPNKVNRLYPVNKSSLNNTLYTKDSKGRYEVYKTKRGTKVSDGYYYYELSNTTLPSIKDIDMTYYIEQCYKIINKYTKNININLNNKKRNCFIDLDGTLISETPKDIEYNTFKEAAINILDEKEIDDAYERFIGKENGGLLIYFLGLCKKYKGFGTIDNFALYLKQNNLLNNVKDIFIYKSFIIRYLSIQSSKVKELTLYNNSKELLEKLKSDGYDIYLYSNWFKSVQEEKLSYNNLLDYFNGLCTIDEYYAKSSIIGWQDILSSNNLSIKDHNIMIGNSSSDITPKKVNIPSIIINNKDTISNKVITNGILINNFNEIINKNFTEDISLSHILKK